MGISHFLIPNEDGGSMVVIFSITTQSVTSLNAEVKDKIVSSRKVCETEDNCVILLIEICERSSPPNTKLFHSRKNYIPQKLRNKLFQNCCTRLLRRNRCLSYGRR